MRIEISKAWIGSNLGYVYFRWLKRGHRHPRGLEKASTAYASTIRNRQPEVPNAFAQSERHAMKSQNRPSSMQAVVITQSLQQLWL